MAWELVFTLRRDIANLHNHPSEEELFCDFTNKETSREVNFHKSVRLHLMGADLSLETQGREPWIGAVSCGRHSSQVRPDLWEPWPSWQGVEVDFSIFVLYSLSVI